MSFAERLSSGREVEQIVEEYMKSFGFDVVNNTVDPDDDQSIWDNLKWGDTFIKFGNDKWEKISFDEKKGSFISKRSWEGFRGNYFIITPKDDCMDAEYNIDSNKIGNARVIKNSTVKSYARLISNDRLKKGKSGSLGAYFHAIKNYIRLEDFMIELVKLHLDPHFGSKGYNGIYIGLRDKINKKMNHVFPKGVEKTKYNSYQES